MRALSRLRAGVRRDPDLRRLVASQHLTWHRGPTFVLSFDVELRADCLAVPEVARMLRDRGIHAAFACIGAWIERYPDEHRVALELGHELLSHTFGHPWHDELPERRRIASLGETELQSEVERGDAAVRALGAEPIGFRTPHFAIQHSARVRQAVAKAGLRYSSSTHAGSLGNGGAPSRQDGVWEFPLLPCPRHPRALLDSWHCTTAPDAAHRGPAELRAIYREAFNALVDADAYGSVYLDPRVLLLAEYGAVLEELERAQPSLRMTTYRSIVGELESESYSAT